MRALEAPSKVAFVRFRDADSCNVALHLHETVMGDRQLRITKSDLGPLAEGGGEGAEHTPHTLVSQIMGGGGGGGGVDNKRTHIGTIVIA